MFRGSLRCVPRSRAVPFFVNFFACLLLARVPFAVECCTSPEMCVLFRLRRILLVFFFLLRISGGVFARARNTTRDPMLREGIDRLIDQVRLVAWVIERL